MEKLVLTTYRKIIKMGGALDQDVAKRSVVSCAPTAFFNHRTLSWVAVDIAKEVGWAEPRAFLDKLIRRLNGNRENYIPPTADELDYAKALAAFQGAGAAPNTEAAQSEAGAAAVAASAASAAASGSTTTTTTTATPPGASTSGTVIVIPDTIAPFMSIQRAARVLFESTPFSMNNLNKAFAAVKELSYACESFQTETGKGASTTTTVGQAEAPSPARRLVMLPDELLAMPTANLTRAMTVAPAEDLQLMHGLSDDLRESLRMMSPEKEDVVRHADNRGENLDEDGAEDDDEEGDMVVTVVAEMNLDDGSMSEPKVVEVRGPGSEAPSASPVMAHVAGTSDDSAGASTAARPTVFGTSASSSTAGDVKPPATVQFLIAHPQLTGFFQNAVMLVVRNAENEAIALVLNNPLKRDAATQLVIARDAICGFPGAHPIYEKHLLHNSVMVGGPVQTGETPDEVALLHQIAGVPGAIPLAPNLFLHGDLDVLMQKLDAQEASPRDIALVVGFAGWGRDQLQGEVRSGVWLVAQAPSSEPATGDFVMDLARSAGASLLVPPAAKAEVPAASASEPSAQTNEEVKAVGVTSAAQDGEVSRGVRRHLNFMTTARDGTVVSWMWALKALGEPYASLGRNQKRSTKSKIDDYMK